MDGKVRESTTSIRLSPKTIQQIFTSANEMLIDPDLTKEQKQAVQQAMDRFVENLNGLDNSH